MHVAWDQVIQQVVNALALGGIYALVAIGLGVVFSVARLVNFAYGELLTLAGYTLYLLGGHVPWPAAFAAAIAVPAVASLLMERIAFRPVRGSEPVTLLLTSFAVSMILQTLFLMFFGGSAKPIDMPGWVQSTFTIGSVRIAWLDVVTCAVTVLALMGLRVLLRATVIGIALRAAAEDFPVTRLMGMNAGRVIATAFLISGALGGIAGILWLANSSTVLSTSGFDPLIKGFIAAVIGGIGSLTGAALAGLVLGAIEVILAAALPASVQGLTDAFVFAVIIVIFLVRPQGLFPSRERAA